MHRAHQALVDMFVESESRRIQVEKELAEKHETLREVTKERDAFEEQVKKLMADIAYAECQRDVYKGWWNFECGVSRRRAVEAMKKGAMADRLLQNWVDSMHTQLDLIEETRALKDGIDAMTAFIEGEWLEHAIRSMGEWL